MRADAARAIAKQAEHENAEAFWEKIKCKLFDGMRHMAEARCYSWKITQRDAIVKENYHWLSSPSLRNKVQSELMALGYKIDWIDILDEISFTISWA